MSSVKIYTTKACGYCKDAKAFMSSINVPFEEIDVSEDPIARDYMINKTGQRRVPVMFVGDEILVGFTENKERLAALAGA